MQGENSDDQSKTLAYSIVNSTVKISTKLGILKERPTEARMKELVDHLNKPLRKMAHATVYFVLAILILLALDTNSNTFKRNIFIAIVICFCYSLTDEFHQMFVDGRTGKITDCLIDTAGAAIACFTYWIGMKWLDRKKKS